MEYIFIYVRNENITDMISLTGQMFGRKCRSLLFDLRDRMLPLNETEKIFQVNFNFSFEISLYAISPIISDAPSLRK